MRTSIIKGEEENIDFGLEHEVYLNESLLTNCVMADDEKNEAKILLMSDDGFDYLTLFGRVEFRKIINENCVSRKILRHPMCRCQLKKRTE